MHRGDVYLTARVGNLRTERGVYVAGGVLVHNCQRAPADTCFAAIDPLGARYRVGISADSSRRDAMEFLTRDLFGDVACEVGEQETIVAGATVDVEVCVVPTAFRADWYRYRQDFHRLLAQMCADEARNAQVIAIASRCAEEGERCLVFTHRVEHARQIDARLAALGVPSGTLIGGDDNAVAFERTKAGLRTGALLVGVGTYAAIAQGIDLPAVSRGVCATPIGNNRQQLGQVRGRICRASGGKDFGRLYYLLDTGIYGRRPVSNAVKWFRTARVWEAGAWVDAAAWLS